MSTTLSAPVSASTSGDNQLVAGVAGKSIRVFGFFFLSAGTVNAKLQSKPGSGGKTDLSGALPLVVTAGATLPVSTPGPAGRAAPWCQTNPGEALVLNLDQAILVAGIVVYDLA
jgi:hypothetical protein